MARRLADRDWKLKYTPEDGDLVRLFYVPALEDARRYDRLTGYFNAGALALAARGIEGLIRNKGRMRLIVGCTLEAPEIEAIECGEKLRDLVQQHLTSLPLAPPDPASSQALELLAWMIARDYLEVKVAVPCNEHRQPVCNQALFHEKAGIIEDGAGDRIAWNGSLNETVAGWQRNWESINVYRSWEEPERVEGEEANFARLWAGQSQQVVVLNVPEAVRQDMLRFMPTSDLPTRLMEPPKEMSDADRRNRVWAFIERAPSLPKGGARVGEATAAVTPWPHQAQVFERLYSQWPPKLLIADEVGLGKTIEAGMLLRQAWLAGRAKRILILAPKAVLKQWQIELREKFNLNWPVYDSVAGKLLWYPSPAMHGRHERLVNRQDWHREPVVIASSQLMRRDDRSSQLLEDAEPWDLVVLDEAHHARRQSPGNPPYDQPNKLLRLMRGLKERTKGLVLLTATPMQVHPIEVWDLLDLLGLPPEWTAEAFLRFFDDIGQSNLEPEAIERVAQLFQATERCFGEAKKDDAQRLTGLSSLMANKVLHALRDPSSYPRRQLDTKERQAVRNLLCRYTPIQHLVSRHTRDLLRRYFKDGMLSTPIASRQVEDRFIDLTADERALYEELEEYIASTYNQASASARAAVGFVMTIYRRRLASSFRALRHTLSGHLAAMATSDQSQLTGSEEDAPDDEAVDEVLDADEVAAMEREVLVAEETDAIEHLLDLIGRLPPDSKLESLKDVLDELRADDFKQAMVFTQYTDTMDFLRESLAADTDLRLMCYSGRGGEIRSVDGSWQGVSRDDARRRFRSGEADVLLCTDAAAEGLNFQFCGALINYDMPWNPMRVEQRIGRIDRLGQEHPTIRIVNLHYEGTVETDVYRALRDRISLFESVVGRLQPILAQLPRTITEAVLSRRGNVSETIARQVDEAQADGFDLDTALIEDVTFPERASSPVELDDLNRVIAAPDLMPLGTSVQPLGPREYGLSVPGAQEPLRVTTDSDYYEENAESLELWSPGNPLFQIPESEERAEHFPADETLKDILDS